MHRSFTINGHRVRTASQRRFVIWVAPQSGAKPWIYKRTDSWAKAVAHQGAAYCRYGGFAVVTDAVTGDITR